MAEALAKAREEAEAQLEAARKEAAEQVRTLHCAVLCVVVLCCAARHVEVV